MFRGCFLTALLVCTASPSYAIDPFYRADEIVRHIGRDDVFSTAIGVAGGYRTSFHAVMHRDALDFSTAKVRILLVGEASWSTQSVGGGLRWFYTSDEAAEYRDRFLISGALHWAPGRRYGDARVVYPPNGKAYNAEDPGPQYLWRWIGMHAPDLVVYVQDWGKQRDWYVPLATDVAADADELQLDKLRDVLTPAFEGRADELVTALCRHAPSETGRITAISVRTKANGSAQFLPILLDRLEDIGFSAPSPARRELQRRLERTPIQVAEQLSEHYGHELKQVVYIPAVALLGRLRLGDLTGDPTHQADVTRIVAPYFHDDQPCLPSNGSGQSGHLIFSELAARSDGSQRERFVQLARQAADLMFDDQGGLRESMPFHNEMSDALFMGGPILAHTGSLTGDGRYFDACMKHLRCMRELVLREDGLYRHSPLDEAAWGRGNGFPALGLALCLSWWPDDRDDRDELLVMFRSHLQALAKHQDPTGCWHQVVDHPDSYRELTSTCMILFAITRGVRMGWLDRDTFQPLMDRAWYAVRTRVADNGRLVDVCTGTGKQKSLVDYYHRAAILGPDDRGGAMALLAATEMAAYQR